MCYYKLKNFIEIFLRLGLTFLDNNRENFRLKSNGYIELIKTIIKY